jgi:hypothetical protein
VRSIVSSSAKLTIERFEHQVRMRSSEAGSSTTSIAVPDVVMTSRMPCNLLDQLLKVLDTNYEVTREADWSDSVEDPADATLLFGAVEYKKFDQPVAYRHLVYGLSTAHSVRKALGLEDQILYGWTSVKSGQDLTMILHASWRVCDQFCSSTRTCSHFSIERTGVYLYIWKSVELCRH